MDEQAASKPFNRGDMTESQYWIMTIPLDSLDVRPSMAAEEIGGVCLAFGAEGVTENPDRTVDVFFTGIQAEAQAIGLLICNAIGIEEPLAVNAVGTENWVQLNTDILEPIACGVWNIIPIAEPPKTPLTLGLHEIAIVPGMGFGTGHHSSTQLALSLLSDLKLSENENSHIRSNCILDIGTGSGILAVASFKLWPKAKVIATDNDPQALTNAKDTLLINNSQNVELQLGTIPRTSLSMAFFDIITANLYAECLKELEPQITKISSSGTMLIQSGVLKERSSLVEDTYSKSWHLIQTKHQAEWNAYLWERK